MLKNGRFWRKNSRIAKAENLINGKIIHRSRQQVDVLLNLLQGNSGASKIYTENGQAKSVNRHHPLAGSLKPLPGAEDLQRY